MTFGGGHATARVHWIGERQHWALRDRDMPRPPCDRTFSYPRGSDTKKSKSDLHHSTINRCDRGRRRAPRRPALRRQNDFMAWWHCHRSRALHPWLPDSSLETIVASAL